MARKEPTLHQALARRGCSSTPIPGPWKASHQYRRAIFCKGKFVGNMNATEGWAFVKRKRKTRR